MKNKGFTLIELLAVIIIVSITSMIIFPAIGNVISQSKKDLYNNQVLDIQLATEKWVTEHSELMDKYHVNDIYISLESIRLSKYLEADQIKNPIDKTNMEGCTRVRYDSTTKKYNYIYAEKTCKTYADESTSDGSGYIIYNYDASSRSFIKDENSNEAVSAGLFIFNLYNDNNNLKVDGQVDNGLYDNGEEYVFRGNNPDNTVNYLGKTWKILSIDKKDFSLKLIGLSKIATNAWDSKGLIDFKTSSSNINILSNQEYESSKIVQYDFTASLVPNEEASIKALSSLIKSTTVSQKVGMISVLDYVNASATDCPLNFLSDNCKNNNYLYNIFGSQNSTWTINNDGSSIWYINNNGLLALSSSNTNKQIYPVIKLSSDIFITNASNGTGNSSNPFILK